MAGCTRTIAAWQQVHKGGERRNGVVDGQPKAEKRQMRAGIRASTTLPLGNGTGPLDRLHKHRLLAFCNTKQKTMGRSQTRRFCDMLSTPSNISQTVPSVYSKLIMERRHARWYLCITYTRETTQGPNFTLNDNQHLGEHATPMGDVLPRMPTLRK